MAWAFWCLFKSTAVDYSLDISKDEASKILFSKIDLMDGNIIFPHYVFGYRDRPFSGFLDNGIFRIKTNRIYYKNSFRPIINGSIEDGVESEKSCIHLKVSMHIIVRLFTLFFLAAGLVSSLISFSNSLYSFLVLFLLIFIMFGVISGIYSFEEARIIKEFEKIFGTHIKNNGEKTAGPILKK